MKTPLRERGPRVALALAACASALVACASTPTAVDADPASGPAPFAWTVGDWSGVRREGGEGDGEPLTLRVRAVLGGAGLLEELEVVHDGGTYRGLSVLTYLTDEERWVRQYVNDVRGRFVRLDGELDGEARSTWSSTDPARTRESRLVSELANDGVWLRTQQVSTDGGATWRVLFRDELWRAER
jgi:hypothetical protein